jgi:hypothetical protein
MLHKRDLLFSEKRQVSFGEFGEKWECGTLFIVFSHERCYNAVIMGQFPESILEMIK